MRTIQLQSPIVLIPSPSSFRFVLHILYTHPSKRCLLSFAFTRYRTAKEDKARPCLRFSVSKIAGDDVRREVPGKRVSG